MGADLTTHHIDWFAQAFREELSAACALVVPSRSHAELLAQHLEQDVGDFAVLPHGSILGWPPLQQPGAWDGEGPLRIAHWGHLQELKGVHVLAEALAGLDDKSRVQLILWGRSDDPDFDESLTTLLKDIDVERRAEFTRDDLATLKAHVAVFPTLAHESHSFVLDEAFALGLPVLASARGALPERIAEGGLVFPPGDASALKGLLQGLLDSPTTLADLGRVLPQPLSMEGHWVSLEQVYAKAANRTCEPLVGQALTRSRRYEELVRILEARCRELDGLREKVTSEARNLEQSLEEFEGSLAGYRSELLDKDGDLAAHRKLIEDLREDLDNHRSELSRVQKDFEATEAALLHERSEREGLAADSVRLQEILAKEREDHQKAAVSLSEAVAETDRLLGDLQDSLLEVTRISGRMDDLEQSEARLRLEQQRLEEVVADLTADNSRLSRENRLALPLVLPARLLLAIKDRLLGPPHRNSNRKSE